MKSMLKPRPQPSIWAFVLGKRELFAPPYPLTCPEDGMRLRFLTLHALEQFSDNLIIHASRINKRLRRLSIVSADDFFARSSSMSISSTFEADLRL